MNFGRFFSLACSMAMNSPSICLSSFCMKMKSNWFPPILDSSENYLLMAKETRKMIQKRVKMEEEFPFLSEKMPLESESQTIAVISVFLFWCIFMRSPLSMNELESVSNFCIELAYECKYELYSSDTLISTDCSAVKSWASFSRIVPATSASPNFLLSNCKR